MIKVFSFFTISVILLSVLSSMAQNKTVITPQISLLLTGERDCNGDKEGTAVTDNCGTCVGGNTGLTACTQDCNND